MKTRQLKRMRLKDNMLHSDTNQNTFIPQTPNNNIQIPGMVSRDNAGLPILFIMLYNPYLETLMKCFRDYKGKKKN